jgi:hypothetical protein
LCDRIIDAAAHMPWIVGFARRPSGLGGDQYLLALTEFIQPAADVAFVLTLCLGARWHRVNFSCIDQVDVMRQRHVDLCMCFGFGTLFALGHGAECDQADLEIAMSEFTILHRYVLCGGL